MFEVSAIAQQCIVDALKPCEESSQTVVLCHTPSEICTDGHLTLGTHDLLEDFIGKESLSLISVFPNMGSVKQSLKNHRDAPIYIDCIVACHHTYDPLDVSSDVVNRMGLDFQYVSQIAFLVDLPKGSFRSYATSAYIIRVRSESCPVIKAVWKKQQEQFDELLIPKLLVSHEEVSSIVNNLDGPLKRHSSKRNSLFDFEGGKNYDSFSFKPGKSGLGAYRDELERLKKVCRDLCKDLPSATFQFRERTNWRWLGQEGCIDVTILFCRNLDRHKLLQLASFLTSCAISFRFSSLTTIVINTAGLDSSILVRLMHYAEVPIPTTMKQGAFSLSITGNGLSTGDRNLLSFDLKVGRIGSLPSVPMQIRCASILGLMTLPLHQSKIGKWIKRDLSGFNICEVVCIDDDQITDSFLQFRVPIDDESNYPKVFRYKDEVFTVERALPYATPISMKARPPQEESVHDHWKKAARLAPQEKASRFNCVAKTENCPSSLQRVMQLRESAVKEAASTFFMYAEQTKMPWCFFTGSVSQQTALDCYSKFGIRHLENKEDVEAALEAQTDQKPSTLGDLNSTSTVHVVQMCCCDDQPVRIGLFCEGKYGWTVSTAELIQCHAYTPCILVMMIPSGFKLTDVCSPSRHFKALRVFSVANSSANSRGLQRKTPSTGNSQLTQISPNRTVTPTSPEDAEELSQRSLASTKTKVDAISPTAVWTEVACEEATSKDESRQMPLLRRSSDNGSNQNHKASPQVCPKPQNLRFPEITTDTQPGKHLKIGAASEKVPNRDANPDLGIRDKGKGYTLSGAKDTLEAAGNEGIYAGIPLDNPVGSDKPLGKESKGNLIGDNGNETPKNAVGSEDTKSKGTYTGIDNGVDAFGETLTEGIATSLSAIKLKAYQQQVVGAVKSHCVKSDGDVQMDDAEMNDVKINTASHKLGVKKDLVSKSCPPKLRTTSPRCKGKLSESRERNQKIIQRATSPRICVTSHAEKNRNRTVARDESGPAESVRGGGQNIPDPEISQLTQQMQDLKGVEQVDDHIIDLIAKIEQENAEQKRERLARITDATQKWCSCLTTAHQERIISLGEKFLRRMDSTICFLIVVYRMLAKANWTRSMVAVDIKQAALYAISRGWFVKSSNFRDYPFSREELAVSAATYLNKIPADAPEDPFRALYIVISHLPFSCAKLFSKGQVSCPFCSESCEVSFPSFTTRLSWTMVDWIDLATCLNSTEPNPWVQRFGWHATECNRSDHIPTVSAFEAWTLLELHLHSPGDYPSLMDSRKLLSDPSLGVMNGQILGFVCTNTRTFDDSNMHYWFVEVAGGMICHVFDSLRGLQRLTQDIAKKLFVRGVLLFFGPRKTPVLKSVELDEAAGVTPRVVRTSKPIQAQGRMRANKVRNLLCRQHGVKKKRCRSDKLNKRPCLTVTKGKGNSRVNQVSAVMSLARNPKEISELSRSKQTILPQQRRLAVGKGKKNDSSTRQIDKLFQCQLKENPDEACKDLELHDVIEDISDEEFVEKGQDPCYESTKTGNVDKGNGETGISNASGLPNNCLSEGNTGNVFSSDRIEEDPIANFSEEKQPCMIEGTAHDNLLTSPAKNKRDTNRTVKTHVSEQIDDMTKQSGTEQCVLNEQEQCTSDLISEGLMSGNNKKQKSFLEEIKVAQCQDEDRKEKRNEEFHASSSVTVPTFLCDDTVPKGGIQGQYGIISLFDGVSSVVRILKQKLQQPPTAIILAELDEKIRGLVCAELIIDQMNNGATPLMVLHVATFVMSIRS